MKQRIVVLSCTITMPQIALDSFNEFIWQVEAGQFEKQAYILSKAIEKSKKCILLLMD